MIVVADASPLHYLVLVEQIRLLPIFYERVLIPDVVRGELQHPHTPASLRKWIANAPSWVEFRTLPSLPSPTMDRLDPGERDAIRLALGTGVNTLLMDDAAGRSEAQRLQLHVTGTLGVLERGAKENLLDLAAVIAQLQHLRFRIHPKLAEQLLKQSGKELL